MAALSTEELRPEMVEGVVFAEDGTPVTLCVPASLPPPPASDAAFAAEAMMSTTNWKLATSYCVFATRTQAEAVAGALIWHLGGAEITPHEHGFLVGSKGYYHYIGA